MGISDFIIEENGVGKEVKAIVCYCWFFVERHGKFPCVKQVCEFSEESKNFVVLAFSLLEIQGIGKIVDGNCVVFFGDSIKDEKPLEVAVMPNEESKKETPIRKFNIAPIVEVKKDKQVKPEKKTELIREYKPRDLLLLIRKLQKEKLGIALTGRFLVKDLGQAKNLIAVFGDAELLKKAVEFVFCNWESLKQKFKLNGSPSIGFFMGYRESIVAEMGNKGVVSGESRSERFTTEISLEKW